jgi:hypothetical protein
LRVRVADRLFGSVAALLLQAGFLFLLFQSVHLLTSRPQAAREFTLILPRLAPIPAQPAAPRAARAPIIAVPGPAEPLPPAPPAAAPQAGLQGFGQSLFGCTPQNYLSMTPEQRSHCPRLGERVQRSDEEDLLTPKSHSKDAARWQEGIDERNWMPTECAGAVPSVGYCLAEAAGDEFRRAQTVHRDIDNAHAKAIAPSPPKLPDIPVRRGR